MTPGPGYANELLSHHPQYQELDFLGCDAQGFTILAVDTSKGDAVAIKILRCTDHDINRLERDAVIQRKLTHPHTLQLREVLTWQGIIGLVMEYAIGGPLSTLTAVRCGLPEVAAKWCFQQVVMAVDFCHQKGYACRDIKLENVLLVNDAGTLVKLCIAGCSQGKELRTPPGSMMSMPAFVAPEILLSAESGSIYNGQMADMWSLGVLLLTMLTARTTPYEHGSEAVSTDTSYLRSLLMGPQPSVALLHPLEVTEECMDLLLILLQRDPKTRCRMGHVLHHPWFLDGLPPGAMSMNTRLHPPVLTQYKQGLQAHCTSPNVFSQGSAYSQHHHCLLWDVKR